MPAGSVGSVWATGTWTNTCWEANTWANVAALAFVLDLNARLWVFLQDHYNSTSDLPTLATRYLNSLSGDGCVRWRQLVQDATDAMS